MGLGEGTVLPENGGGGKKVWPCVEEAEAESSRVAATVRRRLGVDVKLHSVVIHLRQPDFAALFGTLGMLPYYIFIINFKMRHC